FERSILKYAERSSPAPEEPREEPSYAPPTYLTRYADATGEKFSQVRNSFSNPYATTGAKASDKEAAHWRKVMEDELQSGDWKIFHGEYRTQQLDPMFMEPESGLGWLETGKKTLHLVIGTQSSNGCVADTVKMFGAEGCAYQINTIVL